MMTRSKAYNLGELPFVRLYALVPESQLIGDFDEAERRAAELSTHGERIAICVPVLVADTVTTIRSADESDLKPEDS